MIGFGFGATLTLAGYGELELWIEAETECTYERMRGDGFGWAPTSVRVDGGESLPVEVLEPHLRALESKALDAGADVVAVEIDPAMAKALSGLGRVMAHAADFLAFEHATKFNRVVMNPPFGKIGGGDHLDHVRRAHSMLRPDGVLVSVLPSGVVFRQDRRHTEFRAWVAEHGGEITDLPEGSFRESGTGVNTCVLRMTGATR